MSPLPVAPVIADLKPYPRMKHSGVKWLGDVPTHWRVQRIRSVARILGGATPRSDVLTYWNGEIAWITPEDLGSLRSPYIGTSARKITHEGYRSCGVTLAPADSIAVSIRAPIGHVGILLSSACVNQGCKLLIPSICSRYLYYVLKAGQSDLRSHGLGTTFAELSRRRLADFWLPVPSSIEQASIARLLHDVDRRIQRYIAAKQELIVLLEEQKQAVIQSAVTGQIDVRTGKPYPAYMPSSNGQIDDVPAHWEVRRLKQIAEVNPGWARDGDCPTPNDRVTFLPMEAVESDGTIDTRHAHTASLVRYGFTTFRRGDILVAKITPCFENGKGADLRSLPTTFGAGSTEFHVLRARSPVLPQFLYRVTTAAGFRMRGVGAMIGAAGQQRVPSSFVANYPVLLPPIGEQAEIASFLDRTVADLNRAIAQTSQMIRLTQEFVARLTADAVTGQIDVTSDKDSQRHDR